MIGLFVELWTWIVPNANNDRLSFENKWVHEKITSSDKNVHLQLTPELLVYIQEYNYSSNEGCQFTAERIKGTLLLEKTMADRVSYDSAKRLWNLYGVTIRTNDTLG